VRVSYRAEGLGESKDARGPNCLEQRMRLLRSQADEVERLDAAIAAAIQVLETCAESRRAAELRMKVRQLRAKRSRLAFGLAS
jgi:hypothetical protein